jgi:cytochrome c-type biogenesis protein CcmH
MKRAALLMLLLLCLLPVAVFNREAQPLAEDPQLEKRVMALAEDLRCLVCQNESLAGSHADLAVDLRRQIREQMKAGKSDQEIIAFMTDRYGDFILFRPPVKTITYVLWFGPFLLLAAGVAVQMLYLKRRRERGAAAAAGDKPLSEAERKRVEALLGDG